MDQKRLSEFTTERETTVTYSPGDPVVRIWTSVAKHLRAFRNDAAYTEVRSWPADGVIPAAAEFTISRDLYEVARGRRRPRQERVA